MAKIIYETEKAIQAHEEMKKLQAERAKVNREGIEIFRKYCDMEGMYAIGTVIVPTGMGDRGFDYKYKTQEDKEREDKEREQFLIEQYYEKIKEIKRLDDLIEKAKDRFNIEQYGMTTKAKYENDMILSTKRKIERLYKEIEERYKEIEDLKKALEEYEKKFNEMMKQARGE